MGKQRAWTEKEATEEVAFIKRIDPANPGLSFRNDPEYFRSYCAMQANTIGKVSGFYVLAKEILMHARDGVISNEEKVQLAVAAAMARFDKSIEETGLASLGYKQEAFDDAKAKMAEATAIYLRHNIWMGNQ